MKFHLGTNWKMSKTNSQARQFVAELLHSCAERIYPGIIFLSFPPLQLCRWCVMPSARLRLV